VDWVPVTSERFAKILSEEVSSLAPDLVRLYQQYAVQPFHLPCIRDEGSAMEQVFVIAKNGNRFLYFDDVEEDFGVAIPDDGLWPRIRAGGLRGECEQHHVRATFRLCLPGHR